MKNAVELLIVAPVAGAGLDESARDAAGLATALGASRENALVLAAGENPQKAAFDAAGKFGLPVLAASGPAPAICDAFTAAVASVCGRLKPKFVLFGHTIGNMDAAPLLAARLGAACVTGVTRVDASESGPVFVRPKASGKSEQRYSINAPCAVITALPGSFSPPENAMGQPSVITSETIPARQSKMRLVEVLAPSSADTGLARAEVVVAAGRGIGCQENISLIESLAALFPRSAVAGSRPVCDAGWLPANRQVGVTGATVSPKLYIACGISGVFQHVAGMAGSNLIVAVNRDPCAPIFSVAHLGVAEDLTAFIPAFLDEAEKKE